jgi:hypothetical protein
MVGIGGGQDAVSNGVTMVTNAYRTIPVASHVSRKRRRSSGGNSSFIVDKYKMVTIVIQDLRIWVFFSLECRLPRINLDFLRGVYVSVMYRLVLY